MDTSHQNASTLPPSERMKLNLGVMYCKKVCGTIKVPADVIIYSFFVDVYVFL